MCILHTVLCTFPKVLTKRICLTIKSFFSFFWLQYHRTKSSHIVSLVSLMSFVFDKFWHKRHKNNYFKPIFQIKHKSKTVGKNKQNQQRELDVYYLEQCYCNIYRNFKRYLVIDHFLDWDSLYLTVWSTCPNHSFIFIWQSACLKLGTYLLQILLGNLILPPLIRIMKENCQLKMPTVKVTPKYKMYNNM